MRGVRRAGNLTEMSGQTLRVEIRFLTTEEGGRRTPVILGEWLYRSIAVLGIHRTAPPPAGSEAEAEDRGVYGVWLRGGPEPLAPGTTVRAELAIPMYEPGYQRLLAEGQFTLLEGFRVVGHGRVLGNVDAVRPLSQEPTSG
jgi:hypothetical protein